MSEQQKNWFSYPVKVHPHHTDCAGIVWHGAYINWMEEARIEYFQQRGLEYSDFVKIGYELPVVDLALRYHKSMKMGMKAIVKTRVDRIARVKIIWDYRIESPEGQELYVSGTVTLVPVDREKGRIARKFPPRLQLALKEDLD
ncbi:MAG: thioesterase family protein [Prochloraceae cyanobacterium]|nr:thioesterase family protein [Prochloraceae cyanobacterium]